MMARPAVLKPIAAAIRSRTVRGLGWSTLASLPGFVMAGPTGEQVVQGIAAVTRPNTNQTQVAQTSDRAVVNWQSFSVGGQEYVQFIQPGASAAILNRVVGGSQSDVLGRIDANGRVFLVNPQGVYFGPGAKVNAAGLAASALDIRDDDFMAGNYVFVKGTAAPAAAVVNAGELNADQFVVLLGDRVDNEGIIQARLGTVALAAASKVSMQLDADGLVSFAVDEATVAGIAGVRNAGQILADGGRVLMTAKVADSLVATAVNNEGLIRAHSIAEHAGEIFLRAAGGDIVNEGTLDVAGEAGEAGGRILVKGRQDVDLAPDSRILAAGDGAAGGGSVRLVADHELHFRAGSGIDARGGAAGGAGGQVELSAHQGMEIAGDLAVGDGGHVLIDPARAQITNDDPGPPAFVAPGVVAIGRGFIENQLEAGADVTVLASDEIFTTGTPSTPVNLNATTGTGSGNLALKIGTTTFSGNTFSGVAYGSCASLGVCIPGTGGSNFGFSPDPNGNINLAGLNIAIRGMLTAQAGTNSGNVALGNLAALGVDIDAGSEDGNVTVGGVTVLTTSTDANIDIRANAGVVVVNGGLSATATGSESDANVFVQGRTVQITLGIQAISQDSDASVGVFAQNGLSVGGNILVDAARDADINIQNTSTGNLLLNGSVRAFGNSDTRINLRNNNGNLTINGNLLAQDSSAYGFSSVDVVADTIIANQNVESVALGSQGSANLFIGGSTDSIDIGGDVIVRAGGTGTGGHARLRIFNLTGGITLRKSVQSIGGQHGSLDIFNDEGPVTVNGLIVAQAKRPNGDASTSIHGTQIDINGGMTVMTAAGGDASYGGASAHVHGQTGVDIDGNVLVQNLSNEGMAFIGVFNDGPGGITIRDLMQAVGGADGGQIVLGGTGLIQTVENGLLSARMVQIGAFGDSGPGSDATINVRTNAEFLSVAYDGDGEANLTLDNSTFTGDATLAVGIPFYGSYGTFGSGSSLFGQAARSTGGGFNAVKLRFGGNTDLEGDLGAQSLLIEVNNGGLHAHGSIYVGSGALPLSEGDALALAALQIAVRPDGTRIGIPQQNGIGPAGPNAVFRAENGISLEQGLWVYDPDTPYVVFQTDGQVNLGEGVGFGADSVGNDILAQFTAYTPTNSISVEDLVAPLATGPRFSNEGNFTLLPGTTIIVGSGALPTGPHLGSIVIGQNGALNIGDQNILFVAGTEIEGIDNIISTGFVGELLLFLAEDDDIAGFEIPVVDEFNDDGQDDDDDGSVDIDGDGEDDSDELVSQQSNNGQMCE